MRAGLRNHRTFASANARSPPGIVTLHGRPAKDGDLRNRVRVRESSQPGWNGIVSILEEALASPHRSVPTVVGTARLHRGCRSRHSRATGGLEARSIMARSTGSRSWIRPRHCPPTLHGAGPSVRRDPASQSRDSMESDWRTPRQLRTSCLFPGTTLRRELPWWPSRREIVPGDPFNAVTSGRASIRSTTLSSKQIACIKTGAPCVAVDDVVLAATAGALDPVSARARRATGRLAGLLGPDRSRPGSTGGSDMNATCPASFTRW